VRESGVEAEFSDFVATRWPRLVRAAILLGCSPTEAEDVVQSALTRCLLSWAPVRRAYDRDAYVHRVLVNTFVDSRRSMSSRELPAEYVPDYAVPDPNTALGVRSAVEQSLGRLNFDQRAAVVLRYYLDLSEQQMSAALGIPPGTVKSRLARGLRALADDPDLSDHTREETR
jgi:RNA polymerase sigma-70 factor (sigma-E family)